MMETKLKQRVANNLWRKRDVCYKKVGKQVLFKKNTQISFSSNDYLGLSHHPKILAAIHSGVDEFGAGSGGSALVSGYSVYHQQFEAAYAEWIGAEQAMLFSSGYLANMGALQALTQTAVEILLDKEIHASLIDACRLTQAKFKRYRHQNMLHLQHCIQKIVGTQAVIVTESVFSMSGDLGISPTLLNLAASSQAQLLIDDSHGFGILENGLGGYALIPAELREKSISVVSLGKAFGLCGGMVAGSTPVVELLLQFARTYCYDTAIPAAWAKAGIQALEILKNESWRREKLENLIRHFRQEANSRNFTISDNDSHIQIIKLPNAAQALKLAQIAEQAGFWIVAIRPPTVSARQCCIRVSLTCEHEPEDISALLDCLYYANQ